jgi:hypothetical protein
MINITIERYMINTEPLSLTFFRYHPISGGTPKQRPQNANIFNK